MTRKYIRNINKTQVNLNNSMNKVMSGRKFTKMSEDVSSGAKALRIRAGLYKNEQMQKNLMAAQEELKVAENKMMAVQSMTITAHGEALRAQNGTFNPAEDYPIFASNFDSYAEQVFQQMNGVYAEKYLFGGTYNGDYPYSYDANGDVAYLGIPVHLITKNEDGVYLYPRYLDNDSGIDRLNFDPDDETHWRQVPYSDSIYFDAGLNVTVNGTLLDRRSAIELSISGLESFGFGTSDVEYLAKDGLVKNYTIPNNICEILKDMAKCLREASALAIRLEAGETPRYPDGEPNMNNFAGLDVQDGDRMMLSDYMDRFAALDIQMQKQSNKLMVQVAEVGVRTNYMENMLSRYEDEELTLREMQIHTERINDPEEITTMRSYDFAWNITLQFGSMFLPKSLMDYVR